MNEKKFLLIALTFNARMYEYHAHTYTHTRHRLKSSRRERFISASCSDILKGVRVCERARATKAAAAAANAP